MKKQILYAGAALAAGALLYVLVKKRAGESLATAAGREVVGVAGDVAAGAVKGVGAIFGVPDTNQDQCTADLNAGRTLDASFSCPASRFIGSVFNSTRINDAAISDARQIDRIMERQQAEWQGSFAGALADPNSTIPAGYRVNQWGGLEPMAYAGGSATFDEATGKNYGVTGSW